MRVDDFLKAMYNDLFKVIVKAYYEENFDEKISEIINNKNVDKVYLSEVISSLCGVEVSYIENYSTELKAAIKNYS